MITKVILSIEHTHNLGNYENVRIGITKEFEVSSKFNQEEEMEKIRAEVFDETDRTVIVHKGLKGNPIQFAPVNNTVSVEEELPPPPPLEV